MTPVTWSVRPAAEPDLEAVLELARLRRERYAAHEPTFWRPAADAVDRQRPYLHDLLTRPDVLVLVAEQGGVVQGFLVATMGSAPPVYDPGGATCTVDDFAVGEDATWPRAAPLLLEAARAWARDQGAVQLVVVTGAHDEAKRQQLATADLHLTSEWWTGPVRG